MKLSNDIKQKIDNYFDNISAEELYEIAVKNYKFPQIEFELDNINFNSVVKSIYSSNLSALTYNKEEQDTCDIYSAA